MTNKNCYPNTFNQTTGAKYASFANLSRIKNINSSYSSTDLLKGKKSSPHTPAPIQLTKFKCSIPTGAKVSKITVYYRQQKVAKNTGKYPSIGAPTISLYNGNSKLSSKKGQAPTKNQKTENIEFKVSPSITNINSNDFGVRINYPANANSNEGYIRLYYVYMLVTYVSANLGISISKVKGGYNTEEYTIRVNISNSNKTGYNPLVTITSPVGFTFKSSSKTVTTVNNRTFTWRPKMTSSSKTDTVDLTFEVNATYPSGQDYFDGFFTAVENLTNHQGTHIAHITTKPTVDPDTGGTTNNNSFNQDTSDTQVTMQSVTVDDVFEYNFKIDDTTWGNIIQSIYDYGYSQEWWGGSLDNVYSTITDRFYMVFTGSEEDPIGSVPFSKNNCLEVSPSSGMWTNSRIFEKLSALETDGKLWTLTAKADTAGYDEVYGVIATNYYQSFPPITGIVWKFDIKPKESDLTTPFLSILRLNSEEQNRLGDGVNYIAQTNLQTSGLKTYYVEETEQSHTATSPTKKTISGTLSQLPQEFTLEFKLKSTTDNCLISLASVNEYGTAPIPKYAVFLGFSDDGKFRSGYREADANYDITTGSVTSSTYYTLKIVREGTNFKFYQGTTLIGEKTVSWFDNFEEYCIALSILEASTVYIKDMTLTSGSGDTYVRDWGKNFRIGVYNNPIEANVHTITVTDPETGEPEIITIDNTDYDTLTINEIVENAAYWSKPPSEVSTYNNLECEFVHNKKYPLYILITGDYTEASSYGFTMGSVTYNEPCIIEEDVYKSREPNGYYPIPITNTIIGDGSTGELTLPANTSNPEIIYYKFPLDDGYGNDENTAIRGLEIQALIEKTDHLILYAKIKSDTGLVGTRSIILDDYNTTVDSNNIISIGGVGDLWGFQTEELTNIEDWQVELSAVNQLTETEVHLNYGDVKFIIYEETIDHQQIRCTINNEVTASYGAFLEDVEIPAGLKTETKFLDISGTDTNLAFIQNVREKTITLKFQLDSCDLETSTDMLRQITKLLVNERDEYNNPIPKRIEFSHYPDLYWMYVLEDVMETDVEISGYDLKAKLTVPSGVAYKKTPTVTNNVGYVQGLVAAKPVIQISTSSLENISIEENISGQNFHMGFNGDWAGKVVEIDCENRIVLLKDTEDSEDGDDISRYVDFNSDWFRLIGEYNFSTINCTLLSVEYTEAW